MSEFECVVDLVRHAESELNDAAAQPDWEPIIGGRQNEIPLSSLGEDQARLFGEYGKQEGLAPDFVYCSPAKRTRQTCELSLAVMEQCVEPVIDDRLQELEQGDWTNQPRSLYVTHKATLDRLGKDFAAPNGESMNMVSRRMDDFFGSLALETEVEQPYILVYTHGIAIKCWVGEKLGWSRDQVIKEKIDNVSVTRAVKRDGLWLPVSVNRHVIAESAAA